MNAVWAWNCADMDRPVKRRLMYAFDLLCPGIGHLIVKRYWLGSAGLIVFLLSLIAFCYFTIVPFWELLQALLNDAEYIPEHPFKPILILSSVGISILDWLILLLDGLFRPVK